MEILLFILILFRDSLIQYLILKSKHNFNISFIVSIIFCGLIQFIFSELIYDKNHICNLINKHVLSL